MPTIYNIDATTKGVNGFGLPFCSQIYTSTLSADTDTTVSVPGGTGMGLGSQTINKFIAVFSYKPATEFWVAVNAAAAVPAGNTFAASTSEMNPPAKYCKEGDVIHVLSHAGGDISVAFYAIQNT